MNYKLIAKELFCLAEVFLIEFIKDLDSSFVLKNFILPEFCNLQPFFQNI